MTIKYGFFNSVDGDRTYNAEDLGRYLHGIVSSGVYADSSSSLQVLANGTGLVVLVQPGRAMLDYHYMENTMPLAIRLESATNQDRIDAIAARLDMTNRRCDIVAKKGTPAANPARPTPTRSETVKEYILAYVYIPRLATAITPANITDTRPDNRVCGWVTGVIDQVDTSTLYAQWQAGYEAAAASLNEYVQTKQAEFDAWFTALTEELNVRTYIQEYHNSVLLEENTTTLPVGISGFVPDEDVLLVNVGGIIWPTSDYTVSTAGDGAIYVTFSTEIKAGYTVEFRVLQSKIGIANDASSTVLALDADGSVLTDEGAALTTE